MRSCRAARWYFWSRSVNTTRKSVTRTTCTAAEIGQNNPITQDYFGMNSRMFVIDGKANIHWEYINVHSKTD